MWIFFWGGGPYKRAYLCCCLIENWNVTLVAFTHTECCMCECNGLHSLGLSKTTMNQYE
jgi:hypothetical protein